MLRREAEKWHRRVVIRSQDRVLLLFKLGDITACLHADGGDPIESKDVMTHAWRGQLVMNVFEEVGGTGSRAYVTSLELDGSPEKRRKNRRTQAQMDFYMWQESKEKLSELLQFSQ